eukprot:IDg14427t1
MLPYEAGTVHVRGLCELRLCTGPFSLSYHRTRRTRYTHTVRQHGTAICSLWFSIGGGTFADDTNHEVHSFCSLFTMSQGYAVLS